MTLVEATSSRPLLLSTHGGSLILPEGTTVQEVAMACVAAPTLFEPKLIGATHYFDGSLGANNPTLLMLQEAKRRWNVDPDELGLCLSIGSGKLSRPINVSSNSLSAIPNLMNMFANMTTETERTENIVAGMFEDVARGSYNPVYFRFTVNYGLEDVGLDDWQALSKVEAVTEVYLAKTQITAGIKGTTMALEARYMEGIMKQYLASTAQGITSGVKRDQPRAVQLGQFLRGRENHIERRLADLEAERTRLGNELQTVRRDLEAAKDSPIVGSK